MAIQILVKKLKWTKVALREWNKRVFGHTLDHIDALEKQVEEIEQKLQLNWEEDLERELHLVSSDLATWRHREETQLAQMAKLKWEVDGDRNSIFSCLPSQQEAKACDGNAFK